MIRESSFFSCKGRRRRRRKRRKKACFLFHLGNHFQLPMKLIRTLSSLHQRNPCAGNLKFNISNNFSCVSISVRWTKFLAMEQSVQSFSLLLASSSSWGHSFLPYSSSPSMAYEDKHVRFGSHKWDNRLINDLININAKVLLINLRSNFVFSNCIIDMWCQFRNNSLCTLQLQVLFHKKHIKNWRL
jgi:hypothetical protein